MKRIAFANQKGGAGKTTLAVTFAAYCALFKKSKVLVVDLDPQGHAGKSLGVKVDEVEYGTAEILLKKTDAKKPPAAPTRLESLYLAASNGRLAEVAVKLDMSPDSVFRLSKKLDELEKAGEYDLVVIDSPPSMGPLMLNALAAADEVVIPVPLTYLALEGCAEMANTIETLKERYPQSQTNLGLLVATFYRRTNLADEILKALDDRFKSKLARTVIGYSVKIDEAQSHGRTVFEYEPSSVGARSMTALCEEMWRKLAVKPKKLKD